MTNGDAILPKHVAIIMDGNGRWAEKRALPRLVGHRQGAEALRAVVETCVERQIQILTVFAFSSENWRRPAHEVNALMELFLQMLRQETSKLHEHHIRIRFIGDISAFSTELQDVMAQTTTLTQDNNGLLFNIAVNYGGRWEIIQAVRKVAQLVAQGQLHPEEISEASFSQFLCLQGLPDPDLLIRTGGEERISNFLLWHLPYTEFYFTKGILWPDFTKPAFERALRVFSKRQRRFGLTGEQVAKEEYA